MFKKRVAKQQQILNLNNQNEQQKEKQSPNNNTKNKPQQQAQIKPTQKKQHNSTQQQKLPRQQPQKKVKPDYPTNILASSTTQNKQKKQAQLHKQFKSLNYSAGDDPSISNQKSYVNQELLLQQQLAKQKYMHNVDTTKQIKQGKLDTLVYRGNNSYANYALTEDQIVNAEEKFRKIQGPSRINNAIRNTCRFDYNFGLCKDWHDSGYCPFGDSCIYLHDRSNYKTGWEQERDFERTEKERWRRIANPDLAAKQDLQQSLKSIQKYKPNDTCAKCKKQMKTPVEVQCGHIYCSPCAITLNKCVECKKSLSGIMNNAQKKIRKMREHYEEMKTKLTKEQEQNKMKKKKFNEVDSQNVFAN